MWRAGVTLLLGACSCPGTAFLHTTRHASRARVLAALSEPVNPAWGAHQSTALSLDQQCFSSEAFWSVLVPKFVGQEVETLPRFADFLRRLREEPPDAISALAAEGRELLNQYTFPGIDDGREPFPSPNDFEWCQLLQSPEFLATAQEELAATLQTMPLHSDDSPPTDAVSWQSAAWYGWQFLPLRAASRTMPRTVEMLERAQVPFAHRFVGVARQRAATEGILHSDRRNYMLSSLTGLKVPTGCDITVHGERRPIQNGKTLIVDNTFFHKVNNPADEDRFVLMIEFWHPSLTSEEAKAMEKFFAVKDMYTLVGLKQVPWGFMDDEIEDAIQTGRIMELDFWMGLQESRGS